MRARASDAGVRIAEVEQPVAFYLKWSSRIPGACEFLVHFPGDERRCGVYAERPGACSLYPMQLRTGTLDLRADMRCKPTDWSVARVDTAGWRNALAHYQRRWIVFGRIARIWNQGRGRQGSLDQFYDFLLRTYDALPGLEERCGIVMSDRPGPAHDVPVAEIPDSFLGDVDALAANHLSSCTPGAETTSGARP